VQNQTVIGVGFLDVMTLLACPARMLEKIGHVQPFYVELFEA
jgi:hypothetical protein